VARQVVESGAGIPGGGGMQRRAVRAGGGARGGLCRGAAPTCSASVVVARLMRDSTSHTWLGRRTARAWSAARHGGAGGDGGIVSGRSWTAAEQAGPPSLPTVRPPGLPSNLKSIKQVPPLALAQEAPAR
jgi:hypothetical protein